MAILISIIFWLLGIVAALGLAVIAVILGVLLWFLAYLIIDAIRSR